MIHHLPANESQRLAALRSYSIMDTDPEVAYDEISELAAHFCDCPVAVIGLVDETRFVHGMFGTLGVAVRLGL